MDGHMGTETSSTWTGQQADSHTVETNHTQITSLTYDKTNCYKLATCLSQKGTDAFHQECMKKLRCTYNRC